MILVVEGIVKVLEHVLEKVFFKATGMIVSMIACSGKSVKLALLIQCFESNPVFIPKVGIFYRNNFVQSIGCKGTKPTSFHWIQYLDL
jgi:hypothetical protein